WNSVGQTIADPKQIDIDIQLASRASADNDSKSKNEWINEQERLKVEKKRIEMERQQYAPIYAYADTYSDYYYFPSWHSWNQPWGWDSVTVWADNYLGYYQYSGGSYRYSRGPYSGFGFGFGYQDSDSGVGFGIYYSNWD
ncbi:MAG: hypothetical protein P9M03_00135, partial [Candidatus Theseobacter exili]|nr:hypothetical protein [Candidatus Theseobacter exili]